MAFVRTVASNKIIDDWRTAPTPEKQGDSWCGVSENWAIA